MAFKQHFYGSALRIAVLHEQQAARFEGHESLLGHGYQVFQPFRLIRGSGRGMAVAAAVGVDPIHFGIIVVMNLVLGLCTPPVGVCLFAATNIGARYGKCTLSDSVKALVPLLIVNFGVLFLVTYVPFLTVGVANLVMG